MKEIGFSRFIAIWIAYYGLSGLFQLLVVSVISFFHFLLDHKLGVIEDWIFDKGWEIVVLVKIMSFAIVQKFVQLPSASRQPFRDLLIESWRRPSRQIFALCVASFLIILLTSAPLLNADYHASLFKTVISYSGIAVLTLLDVFLLLSLRMHYGFSAWESRFAIFLMSVLFCLCNDAFFPFASGFGIREFFFHLLTLQLALHSRDNWSDAAFFTLLVTAPAVALLGLDPVWGAKFSIFYTSSSSGFASSISIWLIGSLALWWFSKTEQFA